jgi:hypothetical protein
MAFCGKCGQQLSESARFCKSCGTPTGLANPDLTTAPGPAPASEPDPAPVIPDYDPPQRRGFAAPVLAGAGAGVLVLVIGGLAAWQAGFFAPSEGVADAPAEAAPLDEIAAWKAGYTDEFLSESDTHFLMAEANLRDYPSSDGTEVLRSLPEGEAITGRFVRGRQAGQRWFKLNEGGYVWDGNIGDTATIYAAGMDGSFVGKPFRTFRGLISEAGNYGQGPEICDTYESLSGQYSIMFENNIATAFVTGSPELATKKGTRVGMNIDTLKQHYGDALVAESNPYGGTDYFVWQTADRGLRFLVDDTGMIQTIWAGTQSIRYVEGCS